MNFARTLFVLLLGLLLSSSVFAQGSEPDMTVVINGLPVVKVMSDIGGTETESLPEDKSFQYQLFIAKIEGKYVWASRENRELLFHQSGEFSYFTDPTGGGYIKIMISDGKVLYMEHLTLGFKTITYWGMAEDFNPGQQKRE